MTGLTLVRAEGVGDAVGAARRGGATFIAGGTTVVDLMTLGVLDPAVLVDIRSLRDEHGAVTVADGHLRIGALATMTETARHPDVARLAPTVVDAIRQAASPQIRNAATIGGTLLQRTRCPYFRDTGAPCNKRRPGSGCAAIGGDSRGLAILGTSGSCIANYPGDVAVALVALDARLDVAGTDGSRQDLAVEDLHRLPGDRPDLETTLATGELITAVRIPDRGWHGSVYVKVRDRASYAFALTSAAVALQLDDAGRVADLRVVLGGLAAKPWRCRQAEDLLRGEPLTAETAWAAAATCFVDARPDATQDFKVDLGRRTVVRALLDAKTRADLSDRPKGE